MNGDIEYYGTSRDISDRRLKKEIEALPANMLDKIMLMKPVSFRMKERDQGRELGFIAQDVEQLFPELVATANDPSGTKSLNYVGLIAPTIKALQEMKAANDNALSALKGENDTLREDVKALRKELLDLKNGVGYRRTGTR